MPPCLCVQDLLGNFRCVAALDHNFDAVRPPAGRIDFICAVFIGSYAHHTLHILQDGALDAFQHGRRAVVDFVRVGLSELHIALCELTGNIASHVDHGLHARNSFCDLRDYAVRNEDVARGSAVSNVTMLPTEAVVRFSDRTSVLELDFIDRLDHDGVVDDRHMEVLIRDGCSQSL